MVGIVIYSYIVSTISTIVTSLDIRHLKLRRKLDFLSNICIEYKINESFQRKLSDALQYEYKNGNKDIDLIINDLPSTIQNDLLNIIFKQKLSQNGFFYDRPDHFKS